MRYIVGYEPSERGRAAVALAATIAATRAADLDIVVVLPPAEPTFDAYSPDRAYQQQLEQQAREWLDEAAGMVPGGVRATTQVRRAGSTAAGLIEAAVDANAGLLVIGAARGGLLNRFTVGTVANALLHAAPVPVALAPRGYTAHPRVSRVTCALGERAGAEALLDVAIDTAAGRGIALRLMSLAALDGNAPPPGHSGAQTVLVPDAGRAEAHARELAAKAEAVLPTDCPVTVAIGRGTGVEEAVEGLDFEPAELVLVGSSRLAANHRLFLGAAANKMLSALPVPMVVVPRDYPTGMG